MLEARSEDVVVAAVGVGIVDGIQRYVLRARRSSTSGKAIPCSDGAAAMSTSQPMLGVCGATREISGDAKEGE